MDNVVKCDKCHKVYFDIGEGKCPYCGKNVNELPDFFKDFFNNPENDYFTFT